MFPTHHSWLLLSSTVVQLMLLLNSCRAQTTTIKPANASASNVAPTPAPAPKPVNGTMVMAPGQPAKPATDVSASGGAPTGPGPMASGNQTPVGPVPLASEPVPAGSGRPMPEPYCSVTCIQIFGRDATVITNRYMAVTNSSNAADYSTYGDLSDMSQSALHQSLFMNFSDSICGSFDTCRSCLSSCPSGQDNIKFFIALSLFCARRQELYKQMPCLYNTSTQNHCVAENAKARNVSTEFATLMINLDHATTTASYAALLKAQIISKITDVCTSAKATIRYMTPFIQQQCGDGPIQTSRDMYVASINGLQTALSESGISLSSFLPQVCYDIFN